MDRNNLFGITTFICTLLAAVLLFNIGCDNSQSGATPPANFADFPSGDFDDDGTSSAEQAKEEMVDEDIED